MESHLSPIHPGKILLEDFMEPLGISRNRLGIDLNAWETSSPAGVR